ncbi:MAG: CARDB domain-containing protein [Bacteroidota bacterium]
MMPIFQSGCCEECRAAFADLFGSIFVETNEVNHGNPFTFKHLITNLKSTSAACECDNQKTMTAGASVSSLLVDYSPNVNNPVWEPVDLSGNDQYEIPQIPADATEEDIYNVLFDDPGIYRITALADGTNLVPERNENNNKAEINGSAKVYPNGMSYDGPGILVFVKSKNGDFKRDLNDKTPPVVKITRISSRLML